jgi:hypothetical protein
MAAHASSTRMTRKSRSSPSLMVPSAQLFVKMPATTIVGQVAQEVFELCLKFPRV